jgi:HD-like signal output (HDOD) protein
LLGLTNSAYFGLAEPVTNVHEAILRVLGVDTVRSLVLAMAIQRSFNSRNCPAFDTERFWLSSLQTAECCKKIVSADETASIAARDMAYSTGLCHNLGLMALAHIAPAETHAVLEKHSKSGKTPGLAKALSKKFETNHRIVTVALAEAWSLPDHMIAAYQFPAFPEQAIDDVLGRVLRAAIVAVGNTRGGQRTAARPEPLRKVTGDRRRRPGKNGDPGRPATGQGALARRQYGRLAQLAAR